MLELGLWLGLVLGFGLGLSFGYGFRLGSGLELGLGLGSGLGLAEIANFRPKIGQIPLLSQDMNGHNSVSFSNCLFFQNNSNSVQIKTLSLLVKILVLGRPYFCSEASHG